MHGFKKTNEYPIPELDGTLQEYTHEKTGLELVWLERDEENKTFAIAFETLPSDDTGVFHILEHSTLCGSEKYPVKEPFVELMKFSMNTFLNAMTFPDKTVYPISSKNDKDYMNLVSVYLDAVFNPMIYEKSEIFGQEGWHYEFGEDGSVCYNGVVFNEMKGVYSDPDELAETAINEALFPDTPYHCSYGGDPACIPDLTYDKFLEAHRKFYSPSNAYVFVDGSVNIEAVLELLDSEYLKNYEKGERLAPPAVQSPIKNEVNTRFQVSSASEEEGATRLVLGNVIGTYSEREKIIGMEILAEILCGSNEAPLSLAVLESGLAEDINMSVEEDLIQPYVKLELKNIPDGKVSQASELVKSTLEHVADQGIDRELLDAAIANMEFRMMERDYGEYPQGLVLCFQTLGSWLYGGSPAANLQVGDVFKSLKERALDGYFENLIDEILVSNPHNCKVVMSPSHTLGEEREAAEINRLTRELDALEEVDIEKLYHAQEALAEWQMSEDEPEKLAMMPELKLSDIDTKPEQIPSEITEFGGVQIIKHPIGHNGICYINLYFGVNGLGEEELSQLSLICDLLGKLDTSIYSTAKLTNLIRTTYGQLQFSVSGFAHENEIKTCQTKLCASFSTLTENVDRAIELALHILTETKFDNSSAIIDITRQRFLEMYQEINMSGSMAALSRLAASSSAVGVVNECTSGIAYYQYLKATVRDDDFSGLPKLIARVIDRDNLVASFTGDIPKLTGSAFDDIPSHEGSVNGSANSETGSTSECESIKPWGTLREGIVIPSDISFAALGANLVNEGSKFSSIMMLASHIISLEYLWNVIRVQGGAYGTGLTISETGFCGCYSYRDPSAAESLRAYQRTGEYLLEVAKSGADLEGAIIGTIASASPLLTTRMKGMNADANYFKGVSYDTLCERRRQILECTCEDLKEDGETLMRVLGDKAGICVIGSSDQIDACDGIDQVVSL